ncbi:MAG: DUF952 domain-containing protein [Candidatus Riflebacteria bacterium]
MANKARIFHITEKHSYQHQIESQRYRTETLQSEGFIHFSGNHEDLLEVANFVFSGQENLIVLEVAPEKLLAELKWEAVPGDPKPGRTFPHLFGPLNLNAVERVLFLQKDSAGKYIGLSAMAIDLTVG